MKFLFFFLLFFAYGCSGSSGNDDELNTVIINPEPVSQFRTFQGFYSFTLPSVSIAQGCNEVSSLVDIQNSVSYLGEINLNEEGTVVFESNDGTWIGDIVEEDEGIDFIVSKQKIENGCSQRDILSAAITTSNPPILLLTKRIDCFSAFCEINYRGSMFEFVPSQNHEADN